MNAVLLGAVSVALTGLVIVLIGAWARWARGLGAGETVALDNVTLFSARHKLVGRPDRVVKKGETYIPEEWKSATRVNHGQKLQLATYFILIEEEYGVRPPFGVIVLGDGTRVEVQNTRALRDEVLSIAEKIRECRRKLTEAVAVNPPASKCRRCGQRANCDQAKG